MILEHKDHYRAHRIHQNNPLCHHKLFLASSKKDKWIRGQLFGFHFTTSKSPDKSSPERKCHLRILEIHPGSHNGNSLFRQTHQKSNPLFHHKLVQFPSIWDEYFLCHHISNIRLGKESHCGHNLSRERSDKCKSLFFW